MIEDDPRVAETLRRGLVAEGWSVELVGDGDGGLAAATVGEFDAIVCDLMLPGLNGYEVVRELRRREVWTPVLVLTAKDGEYDEADAFDLGADDFLTKPFSFVVLAARLRALLRRGAPERPAVLAVGDLELDPARREVRRAGVDVKVTPREYGLLEYLMRNKGITVSKAQILAAVWDSEYEGDDNVVEVYIGYLRRKIDTAFGRKSIVTVRGAGYRLEGD